MHLFVSQFCLSPNPSRPMIITTTSFQVRREDNRRLPSWLAVDSKHGLISGLPQQTDLGAHTFTVTAHGTTHGLTATDSFTIEVSLRYLITL